VIKGILCGILLGAIMLSGVAYGQSPSRWYQFSHYEIDNPHGTQSDISIVRQGNRCVAIYIIHDKYTSYDGYGVTSWETECPK
jgi:hypothetical protein